MAGDIDHQMRNRLRELIRQRPGPHTRCIRWETNAIDEMVRDLECDEDDLLERMRFHLARGHHVNCVKEWRPHWLDEGWEHFYEFRLKVNGKEAYIETRVQFDDEDIVLRIVSIHEGWR